MREQANVVFPNTPMKYPAFYDLFSRGPLSSLKAESIWEMKIIISSTAVLDNVIYKGILQGLPSGLGLYFAEFYLIVYLVDQMPCQF